MGVGEDGARFFFEEAMVEVAGREVGEDELFGVCLESDLGGIFCGEVVVVGGEFFFRLEVGAFAEGMSLLMLNLISDFSEILRTWSSRKRGISLILVSF